MDGSTNTLIARFGRMCLTVSAALIAAAWPRRSVDDVEALLASLKPRDRRLIVAATLSALALLSLFAVQFGLLGLAMFWIAVIVLIR